MDNDSRFAENVNPPD